MAILNQVCDRLLDTGFFITVDIFDALVIQLAVDNYQRNACCLDALDSNIVFRTLTYQKNTIVIGCCNAIVIGQFVDAVEQHVIASGNAVAHTLNHCVNKIRRGCMY